MSYEKFTDVQKFSRCSNQYFVKNFSLIKMALTLPSEIFTREYPRRYRHWTTKKKICDVKNSRYFLFWWKFTCSLEVQPSWKYVVVVVIILIFFSDYWCSKWKHDFGHFCFLVFSYFHHYSLWTCAPISQFSHSICLVCDKMPEYYFRMRQTNETQTHLQLNSRKVKRGKIIKFNLFHLLTTLCYL